MKRGTLSPAKIATYSSLIARMNLAYRMGMSYGGDRDLYKALGYKLDLTWEDYYSQYLRQDIAKALIDRPVKATWRGELNITEAGEEEDTKLEKAWKKLDDDLGLKSKFARLDRLTGLGKYAVLFLGLNDVKKNEDHAKPVNGTARKLLYVKPISEHNAQIVNWEKDPSNERYGLPTIYQITVTVPGEGENTKDIKVHHTRIIHVVDDLLENESEGIPRLQVVFNRLKDLEKLVGGSAEMFWRGARPGYGVKMDEGFDMDDETVDDLMEQIDEYEHYVRRMLVLKGFNLEALAQQVSDPKGHVDVQIQMLATVTGIPKRILMGSERGELSSTQDKDEWDTWVQARREEFAEIQIVRQFVDRCIEYGVLPKVKSEEEGYGVQWEDLFAPGDKDKAEVGKTRAEALAKYAASSMAADIMPPEAFLELCMGLDNDQVEHVKELLEQYLKEEEEERIKEEEEMRKQMEEQGGTGELIPGQPVPPGSTGNPPPGQPVPGTGVPAR